MKNGSEKRQAARYDYQTEIWVYQNESRDNRSNGLMVNYSPKGMCFKTDEELDVGHPVNVRIIHYDKNSNGPEKYKQYSGFIRWSNELGTSIPGGQFGYGVEYRVPVDY